MAGDIKLETSHWPAIEEGDLLDLGVGDLLRRAADRRPDHPALVSIDDDGGRRRWTYRKLTADAERVAQALLARFEPGEHVAVWGPNRPEWTLIELGAGLAGVILVTVNPALRESEVRHVLGQSRAVGLFHVDEYRDNPVGDHVAAVRDQLPHLRETIRFADWDRFLDSGGAVPLPEVDPLGPAQIQYTSGTTGLPKGALLRHRGIVNNALLMGQRLGCDENTVVLNFMPLFHTGGCVCGTLIPIVFGGTHVLMSGFDPEVAPRVAEEEGCTLIGGVTTMFIAMMEQPTFTERDLSSLRVGWTGGATVPAELVRRVEREFGIKLTIVFGQTETSPTITQTRPNDSAIDKAETVGQPLPHTAVKIVDPVSGDTLPVDEPGELCTRGYLVMAGYYDMPEETAKTIDDDGWLHTGDLCQMDERGYVSVAGRLKDMIIRGGENIYPREIEDTLIEHPAVVEAAVVGVSDEKYTELPAGVVRVAPGADVSGEELQEFLFARLARHKVPRIWEFVDEFPMTPSGKIQKYLLRDRLEESQAG